MRAAPEDPNNRCKRDAWTRLRLLSYNIQAGVSSRRYRDYVFGSWRHLVPHARRWQNVMQIGTRLAGFDLVAIQETDAGSLRTGFLSPTARLAAHGGFNFWFEQVNRDVAPVARHANGLLSRIRPREVHRLELPGFAGRGALVAVYGTEGDAIAVLVAHLALGRRVRSLQLDFLAEVINQYPHCVLMGDLNCEADARELKALVRSTALRPPVPLGHTYPSWRPFRQLDHILVTDSLIMEESFVPTWTHSDHLPVAAVIKVPVELGLHGSSDHEQTG